MALFDAEQAAFMQGPVSLNVGACGADGQPSLARAVGCTISPERGAVRLLLSRTQAALLLAHLRERGAVAAVFSDPLTHRTIQLKGQDAAAAPATPDDLEVARSYRAGFASVLGPLGHPPELIHALLDYPDHDVVALSFTPSAAFNQTPGPGAGAPLGAQA
jgi:hypothetical protein